MSSSLADLAWPVRTERLTIRRATPADAAATWSYRSDPSVAAWLPRFPADRAAYDAWYAAPEILTGRLVVEHADEVIGELHVEVTDPTAQVEVAAHAAGTQAELGWVLARPHQGQGLGTEAVGAVLGICFGPLGLRRVTAACHAGNEASWRLMERLGLRRESHTVRSELHREHGWVDGYAYAMLAEEWRARR